MVFRGNLSAKIDAQGRLKIPATHRRVLDESFGPELYVTSISGLNVLIYPLSEWEQIESKLLEPPKMQLAKQRFLRNTNFYGQTAKMDRQGRVVVPQLLRERAQMTGTVAVMGYLNYLQAWNLDQFERGMQENPFTDEDATTLADLGI